MENYHLKCFLDSLTHFLVNLTPELSHDSHINVSHKNFVRLHFVTCRFWGFMIPKISLTIKKRKQDRQHKTIYLIYQSNGTFRKWIRSVSCSQWIRTHYLSRSAPLHDSKSWKIRKIPSIYPLFMHRKSQTCEFPEKISMISGWKFGPAKH